jgi:membrane protein
MLQKYRDRWPWLDHLVEAGIRYQDKHGDYYGAGITYFSVFALFPLLMVAFAAMGFVLYRDQSLLDEIKNHIHTLISTPSLRQTVDELIDQAVASRGTVGVIGLVGGLWAGLGWMANVRVALTEMWDSIPPKQNFIKTKLGDLVALVGLFLAIVIFSALIAAGSSPLTGQLLRLMRLDKVTGLQGVVSGLTLVITVLASWMLWTFVIARLPRVAFPWRNALRAGLATAIGFTVFTQVATLLIASTLRGPAGATFGPILGLMLFIYFTARIVLLATAWAATDPRNRPYVVTPAPEPVVIAPVVRSDDGAVARTAAAGTVGLLAGIGLGTVLRRRR